MSLIWHPCSVGYCRSQPPQSRNTQMKLRGQATGNVAIHLLACRMEMGHTSPSCGFSSSKQQGKKQVEGSFLVRASPKCSPFLTNRSKHTGLSAHQCHQSLSSEHPCRTTCRQHQGKECNRPSPPSRQGFSLDRCECASDCGLPSECAPSQPTSSTRPLNCRLRSRKRQPRSPLCWQLKRRLSPYTGQSSPPCCSLVLLCLFSSVCVLL